MRLAVILFIELKNIVYIFLNLKCNYKLKLFHDMSL